jgi:hypothetical protein
VLDLIGVYVDLIGVCHIEGVGLIGICVYVYMCICVYVYMCICVYVYMYLVHAHSAVR